MTPLDEAIFHLLDEHPGWIACLAPADADLVRRRREGASLLELALAAGLSTGGVRTRLYGQGRGQIRSGGVLGRLRGLAQRERMAQKGRP